MSLFPIAGTKQLPYQRTLQQQQQEGEAPDAPGPAAWLSGNTSFRPGGGPSDSQQNPYGHYDSQGAFLRAAERYLEDSSSGEDDEDGGAPGGTLLGTAPVAAAAAPEHRISTLKGLDQPVDDAAKRENTDVHGAGGRGRSAGGGMGDASGRGRRALSPSSSPSRSGSSSNSGSSDGSRGHRSRKRKHRSGRRKDRRSRSRSRSRSRKDSSAKHSKKRKKARRDRDEEDEVEKIRRLECAAAAAGLAPREAAALAAAKPLLKGAAPQPGELYYDTRGDLQNLVYEALYGSNVASYHRVDPLGLARGARARRLLPGQVTLYGSTAGGAGAGVRLRYKSYGEDADADDEWAEEGAAGRGAAGRDPFGTRYFAGRTVALERSRRMKRVRMREEAVLAPGQGDRLAGGGGGGGGGGGSLVGADSGGGWLLSRVGGGPTTGRGPGTAAGVHDAGSSRLGLPLPAFLPLQDPAAAAALATAAAGGGRGGGVVDAAAAALAAAAVEGESTEEWVLRRTREFNVAVREAPQDVQVGAGREKEGLRVGVRRWRRRVGFLGHILCTSRGFAQGLHFVLASQRDSVAGSNCACLVQPAPASRPDPLRRALSPAPGPCCPTLHAAVAALRALPGHSGTAAVAAGRGRSWRRRGEEDQHPAGAGWEGAQRCCAGVTSWPPFREEEGQRCCEGGTGRAS